MVVLLRSERIKMAFKEECPYCGSNNVNSMGMGHSILCSSLEADKNSMKIQYRCDDCEKHFYINERNLQKSQ